MFKKLFSSKKSKQASHELPTLPVGFQKTLTNFFGHNAIPSLPRSAQKIFLLVTDASSEALQFVEAIEDDEGLSGRILKIANSVYFNRGDSCESVVEAVATIGTAELRNILSASTLNDLFPSTHPIREAFWAHNLAVASFSRELSAHLAPGSESEAYVAGLLHDVGKLLLLTVDPARYAQITEETGKTGEVCSTEEAAYPFNHTEVGHFIAREWKFSDALITAIRNHHDPIQSLPPRSMSLIVRCADLLAHKLRIGFPRGYTVLQNNASLKLTEAFERLQLTGDRGRDLTKKLEKNFQQESEILALC